jgi:Zn finger protein HypA/HybF involved in hydrogenase expression
MACCDITCRACKHFFQENGARKCPECGSNDLHKVFDESENDIREPEGNDSNDDYEGDYDE